MIKITRSPSETIEFAKLVGSHLKGGDVIAYKGGLGAGKTTFTRGLAIGLGLADNVTSPTFALVNEYLGDINLYHFDMYRITSEMDLETTGFYDYLSPENVLAIEWSENIENELPCNTIFITLTRIDDDTREITIEGSEKLDNLSN